MDPSDRDAEARPDMTPMIDVVFLMIVFFVCIDFRTLDAKLPAFLPKDVGAATAAIAPQERLILRVHAATPGTVVYAPGLGPGRIDPATGRAARYVLSGHTANWEVGPRPFQDLTAARDELGRIARDPASRIVDPATGIVKRLPCVIEGLPGTRYDDVARAVDACHAAGFDEITFAAGL